MTPEKQARVRARFLRDTTPVRLGGIAANLARIHSFSRHEGARDVVESVIDESKHFIEWAGPDAELDTAVQLLALQRQLIRWQRELDSIWSNSDGRHTLSESAKEWSDHMLGLSGLLGQASSGV